MPNPSALTLLQEFHMRVLSERLETLDIHQTRQPAIEAVRQIMVKEN